MPKTVSKIINLIVVKDKGTPTATTREGRNDDLSKTASEDREARERKTAERGSDPIRSDPIQSERERETVFRFLLSLRDFRYHRLVSNHHSPSRKTRGKKGKKERKKERKRVEMMKTMKMMKKKNTV